MNVDGLATSAAGDDGDEAIEGEELRGVEVGHFGRSELWCIAHEVV